jgi:hypothetical protein
MAKGSGPSAAFQTMALAGATPGGLSNLPPKGFRRRFSSSWTACALGWAALRPVPRGKGHCAVAGRVSAAR